MSLFWEQKSNQKTLWLAELVPPPASSALGQHPAEAELLYKPSAASNRDGLINKRE
jgi:hypothetical protein